MALTHSVVEFNLGNYLLDVTQTGWVQPNSGSYYGWPLQFIIWDPCYKDATQIKKQIDTYGKVIPASGDYLDIYYINTNKATLLNNKCSAPIIGTDKTNSSNGVCNWEAQNWGDTLQCIRNNINIK